MPQVATLRNSGPGPPMDSPNKLSVPGSSRTFPRESDSKKGKRIGHRRVTQEGTVTYKKKPTTEIQRALQLGIQHHIGSIQQQRMRDVLYRDFQTIETVQFPASGSKTTPAHTLSDFRFRTYAPIAFRNFRSKYKLDIRDFLNSLCNHELRELSNPGKSGSIFYITQDDEFIIKTVQHREGEFLRALLPSYFMNLMQHPPTLLPKYHGFYCYQTSRKNIRFVVMNNLLPSSVRIHDKYDLKGSTYRRRASDKELARDSPTLKDLDFRERHPDGIWLEAETYDALIKTIEQDCLVLESLQIMDYSLLLGIHNLDQAKRDRKAAAQTSALAAVAASGGDEFEASAINANHNGFHPEVASSQRDIVEPIRSSFISNSSLTTAASSRSHQYRVPPGADGERIIPVGSPTDFVSQAQASSPSSNFQRGTSRARSGKRLAAYCTAMESIEASSKPVELEKEELGLIPSGGIPARSSTGDRLLLYMGIIDILQSYRLAKKLEHGLFALAIDGETVSVAPPNFYSQRFQEFLSRKVFKRIQSPMKKSATKRATVPGRQLSSVRSIDDPEARSQPQIIPRPALPFSRNQNSPLHSPKPIRHASSAHSLFIPPSFLGSNSSSPDTRSGNRTLYHTNRTRPISHPNSRDGDSVGSPMGPDSADEPRGTATEEARGDRCSRELHLRPDAVAFTPLPIDPIRGSAGRHFHTRLVDSQRRARSTLQLHRPQQQQQHLYHQPASRRRWPSHILNELVIDISRSSSMFSLDSSTTSSSESLLAGLSTSDLHTSPCVQRLNSDNPSIVTPSAPKTFIIASTNQENSSNTKPSSTRLIIERDTSKNSDAHELRDSSLLAKMERIHPSFDPTPSTSSFLNPWSHVPLGGSKQHSVTRISSPAIPSHLSQADSLDYFMQDAALRFRERAYDPYGLVRKNLGDSLNGRSVASVISFTNASSGHSQASSGQFSLTSTRSFSCTRTFDRRRRTKQPRIAR